MNLSAWVVGIVVTAVTLAAILSTGLLYIERAAHERTRATYAEMVADAEHDAAEQSEKYRKKDQELRNAQDVHAQEVAAFHLALDGARARSRAMDSRMQLAIATAAAEARAGCAATSATDLRASAGDPIGVLADVLGRADARAGILADIADQRGIAGSACERSYDEAHEALKE